MFKYLLFTFIILGEMAMAQDIEFANRLFYNYLQYKEASLTKRRFRHSDIVPLIEKLGKDGKFVVKTAGKSAGDRDVYLIKIGDGKSKIFLWSQMHGDESTATMALFDIFNFFSSNDSFNDIREKILSNTSIYFMPMVNPDGAEIFQRRNLFEIDINRDAILQQTLEAQILKNTFDEIKAEFGFNLHDQSILNSAGHNFKPATLSFLAPAMNYEKSIDSIRSKSIKLIGSVSNIMTNFIPGHIAKYPDDFEPRAFGDNFQKWGTSTILIESGGWENDPEKQFIRKLNFVALMSAIYSIAEKSYLNEPLETYDKIPFNEKDIMNLIIRNLRYKRNGIDYTLDIGITRTEENTGNCDGFYYKSTTEDIGDLSVYFGYEDIDLNGFEVSPGKTFPKIFNSFGEIEKLNFIDLYKEGFTNVILSSKDKIADYCTLPINIIKTIDPADFEGIKVGLVPNLVIKKNDEVKFIVLNGFLFDLTNKTGEIKNGLITD